MDEKETITPLQDVDLQETSSRSGAPVNPSQPQNTFKADADQLRLFQHIQDQRRAVIAAVARRNDQNSPGKLYNLRQGEEEKQWNRADHSRERVQVENEGGDFDSLEEPSQPHVHWQGKQA